MARYACAGLLVAALMLGCDSSEPGLKGVQGKVTVDGQPAPEGVQVRFNLTEGSYTFSTRTQADGTYAYLPPAEAPLQQGTYQVSISPPAGETIVDETGLSVGEAKVDGPQNYGKFSDPKASGIEVELGDEVVTLDIDVQT